MFWFFLGAVLSTISLSLALIASETLSYIILSVVAKGPTRNDAQSEMFDKISGGPSISATLLIFTAFYGVSVWCFFFGLYRVLTLVN